MKVWLTVTLLALVTYNQGVNSFTDYNATAIKRFVDELTKLGVTPPAVTPPPEKPVQRPAPIVKAPAGDFRGFWYISQFGRPVAAFRGIPYAKPPVGPLRFKEPQPLTRLPDIFNATKAGSPCSQKKAGNKTLSVGQEDCLYLNIHIPLISETVQNKSLPVIFFIHGGAFVVGSGNIQARLLLEKDIVLVSMNYRLGALGFLTTEDGVIPGNLGLKDQVAALRWTVENIASFGGDPTRITVAGLSAGAASVDFLKLSPLTKGLLHRAIAQSGSAYAPWALSAPGEMRQNVGRAATFLNCPAEPSTKLLECLQTKTADEISSLILKMGAWGQRLLVPFKVVVEGNVTGALLPEHPAKLFERNINDIPYLTGICSEEGSIFGIDHLFSVTVNRKKFDENFNVLAPPIGNLAGPKQTNITTLETLRRAYIGPGPFVATQELLATKLFGDIGFMWPAIKTVLSHAKRATSPVYFYYFDYKEIRRSKYPAGVSHGNDMLYLLSFTGKAPTMNVKMSTIYSDIYANFARDGTTDGGIYVNRVPSTNLANATWRRAGPEEKDMEYLHIISPLNIQMKKNLYPERWTLLKTLLEDDPPKY